MTEPAGIDALEARASEAFLALVAVFRKIDSSARPARDAGAAAVVLAAKRAAAEPARDLAWIEEARERIPELTKTELAAFRLAGMGMTNREIAGALFISPLTVRTHIKRAHDKLAIAGRARLALAAHILLRPAA